MADNRSIARNRMFEWQQGWWADAILSNRIVICNSEL